MGIGGVPLDIKRESILESIKKKKGVGSQICADLSISYTSFYKLIKVYSLEEELREARRDFDDTICDMAETALMRALHQKEDYSASLSSAKYVLNNKGKERGYTPVPLATQKEIGLNGIFVGIKEILDESGGASPDESEVEIEQPVSDSKQKRRLRKIPAKPSTE